MRELLSEAELKAYRDYAFNWRTGMNQTRLFNPLADNHPVAPTPTPEVQAIFDKMQADPQIAECLANFESPEFEKFTTSLL
jgi:hypothetical protein